MEKTSRRKIPKMWKTYKNLRFWKVFWGSAGTKFFKKRSKNLWKIWLKSKSILEAIFSTFWSILGAILEAKIDQKTKKNDIKNKSDFKTDVWARTTRGSSLVRDRPLGGRVCRAWSVLKKQ